MENVFESLELDTGLVTMPEDKSEQKDQEKESSNTKEESTIVLDSSNQENDTFDSASVELDNAGDYDDEDVDPGIELIYNQMKNLGFVDELEEGQKLDEDYLRSKLPEIEERAFLKSIAGLSTETKQLLQYAYLNQGQDTPEKLKEFFDNYIESDSNLSYQERPKEFLRGILKDAPLMSEKDIEEKLEDWDDEGVLEEKAKLAYQAQQKNLEEQRAEALKEAEENRKKQMEIVQQFSQNVENIIEEQNWSNEKQSKFIETVQNVHTYNQMISSSPKAYVQLMNFISYFDPEAGEFNLDNWIATTASTKEAEEKTKKLKQDLLSSAISKASRRGNISDNRKRRGSDPLEVVITPEYKDLLK